MKHIVLFFAFATIISSFGCEPVKKSTPVKANPITGIWVHNSLPDIIGVDGFYEMKIITENSFSVLHKQANSPVFILFFQGSYELTDSTYIEKIEYSARNMPFSTMENKFKSEIKDGLWYIKGEGNPYNQVWRKKKE